MADKTLGKVPVSSLGLGDVVRLWDGAYGSATVRQVHPDGTAQLFRPYVQTADFSCTSGVIPYVGIEDFRMNSGFVELLRKGDPLK